MQTFNYPLLSGALISSVAGLLHNRIMTPNIQECLSLRAIKCVRDRGSSSY